MDLVNNVDEDDWASATETDVRSLIALPFYIAAADYKDLPEDERKTEMQENLLWTIRYSIFGTAFFSSAASLVICGVLFDWEDLAFELWGCTLIGLIAGITIGVWTEYATSFTYKPTKTIAKKGKLGPAPVVIQGIGIGMLSTMGPTLILFAAILGCYELCSTYGIAIAAVGMLSTLGLTLATDAFGPVADNAGGLAEMAERD